MPDYHIFVIVFFNFFFYYMLANWCRYITLKILEFEVAAILSCLQHVFSQGGLGWGGSVEPSF